MIKIMQPFNPVGVWKTSRVHVLKGNVHVPLSIARDPKGKWIQVCDVVPVALQMLAAGTFLKYRVRNMSDHVAEATEILESAVEKFSVSLTRFDEIQDGFAAKCKRASGNVRDASEKLAQGIERVEKAANFDRLERYVTLLERAATAMTILADLEAKGKLEKIASAIR